MSDHTWETFDGLFTVAHQQGRRIKELEDKLDARNPQPAPEPSPARLQLVKAEDET